MVTLPSPLTPADCDLTDFKFMPLLVGRLRDSDLASEQTPEENWAAVLLWGASWHQVPAASLPDVDATIAKWAGYMMRGKVDAHWKEVRKGAMRGFILCSDGRWYHPVVAEVAREAWTGKLKQRLKTECNRIKKHNERHGTRIQFPDFETWVAMGCPTGQPLPVAGDNTGLSPGQPPPVTGETPSKGQGEGQGEGQGQGLNPPPPPTPTAGSPTPATAEESDGEAIERYAEARHDDGPPTLVSKATAACAVLRSEGVARVSGSHPRLLAVLNRGAGMQQIADAAKEALLRQAKDPFAYALSIVEGQMDDAQRLSAGVSSTATKPRNGNSGSAARAARMAEACPTLVNGHAAADFIDAEALDVTPRRVG